MASSTRNGLLNGLFNPCSPFLSSRPSHLVSSRLHARSSYLLSRLAIYYQLVVDADEVDCGLGPSRSFSFTIEIVIMRMVKIRNPENGSGLGRNGAHSLCFAIEIA